jgi:hypothetical protein
MKNEVDTHHQYETPNRRVEFEIHQHPEDVIGYPKQDVVSFVSV